MPGAKRKSGFRPLVVNDYYAAPLRSKCCSRMAGSIGLVGKPFIPASSQRALSSTKALMAFANYSVQAPLIFPEYNSALLLSLRIYVTSQSKITMSRRQSGRAFRPCQAESPMNTQLSEAQCVNDLFSSITGLSTILTPRKAGIPGRIQSPDGNMTGGVNGHTFKPVMALPFLERPTSAPDLFQRLSTGRNSDEHG